MKRLLLDTQALIWWDADDTRLGERARAGIQNADEVYVSAASAWEIAIKQALGRLETRRRPADVVTEAGFSPLPITFEHASAVGGLPPHHSDPFNRLLVAAAQIEGLTIVTSDQRFARYGVPFIDARH